MPDSLHIIQPTPAPPPVSLPEPASPAVHEDNVDLSAADDALLQQVLSTQSATTVSAKEKTAQPYVSAQPVTTGDTLAILAQDTVLHTTSLSRKGLVMESPSAKVAEVAARSRVESGDAGSWIMLALILLFLLIAFRMRHNFRYLKGMLHDTVNSRVRQNMFVDTMRETSFSLLLNLLAVACIGLLLSQGVNLVLTGTPPPQGLLPPGLWVCLGLSGAYYILQCFAYLLIGRTFTTSAGATLWLQGFKAVNGLLGLILFPLAMLALFYPIGLDYVLAVSLCLYFIGRLLFIFKGMRIFLAHRTYYILFLYYLCSVEIVPILLIWHLACLWR